MESLIADKDSHIIERTEHSSKRYEDLDFKIDIPKHLYNLGEIYNLCIEKGTLTDEEKFKIQEHAMMGIKMLEQLPFPKESLVVYHLASQTDISLLVLFA